MKAEKVEVIDVADKMDVVASSGLDDDMYENALDDLQALQCRYNCLVEEYNALKDQLGK